MCLSNKQSLANFTIFQVTTSPYELNADVLIKHLLRTCSVSFYFLVKEKDEVYVVPYVSLVATLTVSWWLLTDAVIVVSSGRKFESCQVSAQCPLTTWIHATTFCREHSNFLRGTLCMFEWKQTSFNSQTFCHCMHYTAVFM